MILTNPELEQYSSEFSLKLPEEAARIHEITTEMHPHAHLMSSILQGQYLAFISKMLAPEYILEIGTFTGFSTLCMAEGLKKGGELHSIELREADVSNAKLNFSFSPKNNQIHLHPGNAKEIIPILDYEWDLVFIDADKVSYIEYYELVLPRLKEGGIIIADNVLFHGKVVETGTKDKNTKAIDIFNRHVNNDHRTHQLIVPIRDGLMMIKKNNYED
jgi:caffeoyl-CoA O-methyltransferase